MRSLFQFRNLLGSTTTTTTTTSNRDVNVEDYGAVEGGVVDCTQAFIDAMNACNYRRALYVPPKKYLITNTIVNKARRIYSDAPYFDSGNQGAQIVFTPPVGVKYDLIPAFDFSSGGYSAVMENITIHGNTGYSLDNILTHVTKSYFDQQRYEMFSEGVVAIQVNASATPIFRNVATKNCKVGLQLNNNVGHVTSYDSNFGGLLGIYCTKNAGDYFFQGGNINGVFAGVCFGVKSHAGHSGGFAATMIRVHMGFSPYSFYQVNDDDTLYQAAPDVEGLTLSAITVQHEQVGEAVFKLLPKSKSKLRITDGFGLSWTSNTYTTPRSGWSFCLPNELLAQADRQNYAGYFGQLLASDIPSGTITGNLDGSVGSVVIENLVEEGNLAGLKPERANIKTKARSVRKILPTIEKELSRYSRTPLRRGNLLVNPEVVSNYVVTNGTLEKVSDLSTLPTALSNALINELGKNPTVLKFTPTGGSASIKIPLINKPIKFPNSEISLSFWIMSTTSGGTGSRIGNRETATSTNGISYGNTVYALNKWEKSYGQQGTTPSTTMEYNDFELIPPSSGAIYFCGVMVAEGDVTNYSSTNHSSLDTDLELVNSSNGLILKDTATGTRYKISITNGVITPTPL